MTLIIIYPTSQIISQIPEYIRYRPHRQLNDQIFFSGGSTLVSNLKIAVVCSSNQNRSMEAHNLLK